MTEKYAKAREKAIRFLKLRKQDFNEAIAILEEAEFKPVYVAKIKKAGENPDTQKGLMQTLYQMIRAWAAPTSIEMADEMEPEVNIASNISEEKIARMDAGFATDDSPAGMLIRHFSDLYKTRAKLHRSLSEVGEGNDEQSVSKRKDIILSISAISQKMDTIWPTIDAYETNGTQPSLQEAEMLINGNSNASSYNDPQKVNGDAPGLPASYDDMSREQLMAERKNLSARIRRTRNKIEYQAEAVAGKAPNPLPEGSPKRVKLEKRIENLEKILYQLDLKIAQFG